MIISATYPKAAYLEYRQIIDRGYPYDGKGRAARTAALGSFIDKYEGRAVSLYGKAVVLRDRFDSLSRPRNHTRPLRPLTKPFTMIAD